MIKNVAGQKIGAQLVTATDGSAFTGSVTVAVTVDAGTQATGSVGAGACAHEGGGYHTYAPAQAETNGDLIAFTFSGSGAVPVTVQAYTQIVQPTAAEMADAVRTELAAEMTDIASLVADVTSLGTDVAAVDTDVAALIALLDAARAEPGQGAPPVNPDVVTKIDYLYKAWRNKVTQTSVSYALFANDAVTVDHKATVSDDGTTFTKAEIVSGP